MDLVGSSNWIALALFLALVAVGILEQCVVAAIGAYAFPGATERARMLVQLARTVREYAGSDRPLGS